MKNFGLSDLRLVRPKCGWPSDAAISTSVGAVELIHNAPVFESAEAAVADLQVGCDAHVQFLYGCGWMHTCLNQQLLLCYTNHTALAAGSRACLLYVTSVHCHFVIKTASLLPSCC